MKREVLDSHYIKLVANIEEYFDQSSEILWDRRNKIRIIDFLEEKIVAKAFKIPHIVNRVAYSFFRDSKAKRSYENSLMLDDFVPKPIGYVEFYKFGLLQKSYFLSTYYPYDFTIREVLLDKRFKDREKILREFAYFTYRLHEMGAEHLDYSPGNILIKYTDKGYEFKVIDVNRMRFGRISLQQRVENFSKLWAVEKDLTTIAKAYAVLTDADENECAKWAIEASQKHKAKVNMKKRLKGKEVVD